MSEERWKPETGERYYYIDSLGNVLWCLWGDTSDTFYYKVGNCFKTKEEAEKVAEKFRKLLADNAKEPEKTNLPKLTVEVFDREDCPEWAKYAAVSSNGRCLVCREYPVLIGGRRWANPESYWERTIDVKFDASDWQNSLIERPVKELPEWCEVGEWVYSPCGCDPTKGTYFKITQITNANIIGENDVCHMNYAVQARLKPYNAAEMKALVGKVLCYNTGSYLVTAFENRWNQVKIESVWRDADELKNGWTQLNGIPCGHFEHLNDKGEWVE